MRYFLLLMTGLLLSGVWGCSGSDKPKLVMVTNATFRPYEFVSGQKIDGIDPAIVREIADAPFPACVLNLIPPSIPR